MNHLHVLKTLHEERIKYYKKVLSIISSLNTDVKDKLNTDYSHDMNNFFNETKLNYKIRESNDRLYVIDLHENTINRDEIIEVEANEDKIDTETSSCVHNIITDLIDIDPDR